MKTYIRFVAKTISAFASIIVSILSFSGFAHSDTFTDNSRQTKKTTKDLLVIDL